MSANIWMCVPVNVGLREGGCREFGGPYINQFHYHRDRGMSGFPLRATSRDSELGGEWECGFVSYDFDLAIFR